MINKELIIEILFKDMKHSIMILRLQDVGIDLDILSIDLLENVLDIIGFPQTSEGFNDPFYEPKENDFLRDYLHNEYFDKVISFYRKDNTSEVEIIKSIKITKNEAEILKEKIADFVNWLYEEYSRIV